ncbi:MAG TPA: peptide-methionine (S)-S-oxide reductase MsrA [Usitatibacteraceae bacterium]|nr:peptide-methionine (S)-S-oxide reductase MsrA [Usitatibacteraceae bacterium]
MATEVATLAGGCFWCLEAVFDQFQGVESVESGYMGGDSLNPSYEDICTGDTGHAEVVRVTFDPAVVGFRDLLAVFFTIHDPTTPNRQGNDVGTQYRSAIFFHSPEQERAAREVIARLSAEKLWANPIVTEVVPASTFWQAEDYHQEYFARVGSQNPYCSFVVEPKVAKFRKAFTARLKKR